MRLASHANYRDFVTAAGLEYYELGGDPKILAGCNSRPLFVVIIEVLGDV